MRQPPEPGLEGTASVDVTEANTARAIGSGTVPVLATPEVAALAERAAVAALDGALPDGSTSVGTRLELDHLAPTPVGGRATAVARLETVEGRRLGFGFEVRDGGGVVARGAHARVIVNAERFVRSADERTNGGADG